MRRINFVLVLSTFISVWCIYSQQTTGPQKRESMGYVRLWPFANSIKSRIAVLLVGGASQPIILTRSAQVGRLLSYREVPPGKYKLVVHAAAADQSASATGPELIPSVYLNVTDHTYQTVIIEDEVGGARILALNDGSVGVGIPPGGKRLRILNFAGGVDASFKNLANDQVISPHIGLGKSEHIFSNNPGTITVVMSNKLPNGHEAHQNAALDFNRCDSITAILVFDQYHRLTFQVEEDGRAN